MSWNLVFYMNVTIRYLLSRNLDKLLQTQVFAGEPETTCCAEGSKCLAGLYQNKVRYFFKHFLFKNGLASKSFISHKFSSQNQNAKCNSEPTRIIHTHSDHFVRHERCRRIPTGLDSNGTHQTYGN